MGWHIFGRSALIGLLFISPLYSQEIFFPLTIHETSDVDFLFTSPKKESQIPDENLMEEYMNPYLTNWGKDYLYRIQENSIPYRFNVSFLLWQSKCPQELMNLPVIESAWDPMAISRSGALGIWQFMDHSTPDYFTMDRWRDDRRDFQLATQGAIEKIHYNLQQVNSDWLLALAGYNCGINHIIRQWDHGQMDYWTLREKRRLPEQTLHYIPRFLSVNHISARKVRYNIPLSWDKSPYWITLPLLQREFLLPLADRLNLEWTDLQRGNPELNDWLTPPLEQKYKIKIPLDRLNLYYGLRNPNESDIMLMEQNTDTLIIQEEDRIYFHRIHLVEEGETLWEVGLKYSVGLQDLLELNSLESSDTLYPGTLLFLP